MIIKTALTEQDIAKCEKVILELRPHLKDKNIWELYETQLKENFEILYVEVENEAVAFIGYRTLHILYSGKTLYIDDLCSLPVHRGKGYAGKLLDHVFKIAAEQGYTTVSLDSGTHRHDAHRLYMNKGFRISSHHFEVSVK